jgi:redox-regulated HSP33 family molecular chaperone
LEKQPRKENTKAPMKTKKVIQLVVEQHHVNTYDPQSTSQACYTNEARTSKVLDNLVLGNHEASKGIEKNSMNHTNSGDV